MNITIHSQDFEFMRKAGRLAAETLDFIAPYVKVGVTTNELNDLCHDFIINADAILAPLNYRGYPKSICTSKNAVVCHGVPDDKPLKDGDILNIDVTVILNGWHGDTSRMFWVGKPSIKAKRLCDATYHALMEAIKQVKPGNKLNEIGLAIEKYIRDFGYAPPNVVHFYDQDENLILKEGKFFTIEPMMKCWKT